MKRSFRELRNILKKYESVLEIVLPEGKYDMFLHRYSNQYRRKFENQAENDLIYLKQVLKLNKR